MQETQDHLTALLDLASRSCNVQHENLTDARLIGAINWRERFPTLSEAELADVSRIPDETSYATLYANVAFVVSYASGTFDGDFGASVEACKDMHAMQQFMRAFVDILIMSPHLIAVGVIDVAKLREIRSRL